MPSVTTSQQLCDGVLDAGSFITWDTTPVQLPMTDEYRAELVAAQEKSGVDESVVTGEGCIRGRRVAVIACEFRFLAGSIGVAAAERVVSAVERATAEKLPLLASPTSGGTRMQEGTVAFLQMVKIAAAIQMHKEAHLPYLVYLRHPTTGGVFASWGSLGHVTVAEPGALVGFLGPRVYESLHGERFPDGVQTSENLYQRGVIDGVVPMRWLRPILDRVLRVLSGTSSAPVEFDPAPALEAIPDIPAWESVLASRSPIRPGARSVLRHGATTLTPLSGTGQGESDRSMLLYLARIKGTPCVVLAQDRTLSIGADSFGPAALREARRGMRLAEELNLPLVLIIDTMGAALSKDAEERGLAGEIARCLAELVTLRCPTVSVLLGQGTGGGALAMLPADRVLCALNGWLAPLPPEGASAIVYRSTGRAADIADDQQIRSRDLVSTGIADAIIPEFPDAAQEPIAFSQRVALAIAREIRALTLIPPEKRYSMRLQRYRNFGLPRADAL
ncbi:acetyl-CoA carboxylase carboxyltransferase subunit alpha/beta [Hoyosella rhizosphaerae]|uniref:Acetyl-coenzyme A carboxylase carboxyl transferase subunit beta n=1 Tax=Hoyosella rhizosphaerae TaxID=1755582 RepID=A0A916UHA7_9ACTN|nr:carboxyl transferase domain-containing protein [Hoyosella rhizosphaerae]MBN4928176.1 acetyl-CoA carboxylase carboxyltransferase subunit alpha/beta [Hoyosella rhizosphaerae]GGC73008.1 putative acetyl-coenzyme A carboxylase carboxyl transferase subunit beta [Hoyosella rhizosphaerae]